MHGLLDWIATGFDVFMELARLLLDFLKVLAWPSVVLILVLVYKRPIIGVLSRLRKATGPGVALELDARELAQDAQEVAAVEASTAPAVTKAPPSPGEGDTPDDEKGPAPAIEDTEPAPQPDSAPPSFEALYQSLRSRHPEYDLHYDPAWNTTRPTNSNAAIILSAWADVVDDAGQVAKVLHVPNGEWSVPVITNILTELGYVPSAYQMIVRRLQSLRNKVGASQEPPTEDVVVDFLSTSLIVREQLQKARRRATLDEQRLRDSSDSNSAANDVG